MATYITNWLRRIGARAVCGCDFLGNETDAGILRELRLAIDESCWRRLPTLRRRLANFRPAHSISRRDKAAEDAGGRRVSENDSVDCRQDRLFAASLGDIEETVDPGEVPEVVGSRRTKSNGKCLPLSSST